MTGTAPARLPVKSLTTSIPVLIKSRPALIGSAAISAYCVINLVATAAAVTPRFFNGWISLSAAASNCLTPSAAAAA